MEESGPMEPNEPKAKPKARKASKKRKRSKKGKEEKDFGLTSVIGNGEQPDESEGSEEIFSETETSPSPLHMSPGTRPWDLKDCELMPSLESPETEPDIETEEIGAVLLETQSGAGAGGAQPKEKYLNGLRTLFREAEEGVVRDDEDHGGETAAELFIKGGTERFRSLSSRAETDVRKALCCMFYLKVELTLRRASEFLIFLLAEARVRLEEDLEEGERLARMHGEVQQTAIVLVEKLRANDQEMLWSTQAGLEILMQFQLGDARLFFARPSLQQIMLDVWQGVRPDYFQRSWCKQLQVWMRLLLYGFPNLVMVFLWAVAPGVEDHIRDTVASDAEKARREEEQKWHNILQSLKDKDWPYKMGKRKKVCWGSDDFEDALREECRERVFLIQCRVPLLISRYRKCLAIFSNLAFAAYLIGEKPSEANVPLVLILSAGAWLGEVAQLLSFANSKAGAQNSFAFWFMDRVNVMELFAFTCIGWNCVLVLIRTEWVEFAQQFKALGVLFLGISQCMAILRMSSVFGPLVSMTMNMIVDMIQWVTLLAPIIACLVAALITLFKTRDKSCLPFEFDYLEGLAQFFNVPIGEEMPLACVRGDQSPAQVTGPFIMNMGLWMIMILMLNMLIAMMAKTFDRIYESAMVDFQYHFIGNLLQMVDEPAVPPILRTLGVPWTLCSTCWRWISQRGRELPQSGRREGTQQAVLLRNSSFHAMHQEQQQRDAGLREAMLRVDVNGKPTDEDQCIGLLYESVTSFVSEHASDTQVQDDLWRKQIARRLFLMDIKLETKVDTLTKELSKTKVDTMEKLDKLTAQMDALLRRARPAQARSYLEWDIPQAR
ncbi:unnamed protein product [Durusdinium trenchii]